MSSISIDSVRFVLDGVGSDFGSCNDMLDYCRDDDGSTGMVCVSAGVSGSGGRGLRSSERSRTGMFCHS